MNKDLLKKLQNDDFRKQLVLGGSVGLFFLFIILSLISPSLTSPPPKGPDKPDFSFEGVTISFYDDEKLTWQVTAQKAEIFNDKDAIILRHAIGTFDQDAETEFTFSAPKSVLHFKDPTMHLTDANATVNSPTQGHIMIFSRDLEWNRDTESLKGRGFTQIQKDNIILEGELFDVRLPAKTITMAQNTRTIIKEKP